MSLGEASPTGEEPQRVGSGTEEEDHKHLRHLSSLVSHSLPGPSIGGVDRGGRKTFKKNGEPRPHLFESCIQQSLRCTPCGQM
jgi:hypothetical protein